MPNPLLLHSLQAFFRLVAIFDRRRVPYQPETIKSVLVVNTTAIGDTLLSTAAIRQLREKFPCAHITVLLSKAGRAVLTGNPNVDEMILHPGKVNIRYLLYLPGLLRRLRRRKFDLAVVLHANDPDILPLLYLSGIPHRYGWAESKLAFLLTMPVVTRQPGIHALTEKVKNLKVLGIDSDDEQMELYLTDKEEAEARRFLAERGVDGPYVCLHPFGNRRNRWWLRYDYLKEVIALVHERFAAPVVLVGGARHAAHLERLGPLPPPAISAVGAMPLRSSAALIKNSRVMVSTDSGPLHIAQALNVPTVGLFGPSLPSATGPRLANSLVLKIDLPCRPCTLHECDELTCTNGITPVLIADAIGRLWGTDQP